MKLFMKKRILIVFGCVVALLLLTAAPAFAGSYSGDLLAKSWRVYKSSGDRRVLGHQQDNQDGRRAAVPIPGVRHTDYRLVRRLPLLNYNVDLTGKTITATASWGAGTYKTRGAEGSGAYVRIEFQDTASGPYDSNDYWWCTQSLDLNTVTSGTLTASLANRSIWINQSGKSALDTTEDWVQWQGDVVHMSPYDGFTQAMKNVKQISLSFGNVTATRAGLPSLVPARTSC